MKLQNPELSLWKLFRIWTSIGLQSFGGGASTTLLIQRAFIDTYKLMTMEDFTYFWALCVMTPGINLVALTVLIGRRFGGTRGIAASLAGLLIPSAVITCLLAAGFKVIQSSSATQAIVRGIVPATGGIMVLVGLNFARPLLLQAYKEGMIKLVASIIIILVCTITITFLHISVIPVLFGAAILSTTIFTQWRTVVPIETGPPERTGAAPQEDGKHD